MAPALITLLLLNALFNAVVWPRFYGRVAKDARARDADGKPTAFLIVHAVLIGTALLLAVVSAVVAVAAIFTGV
ncbi:SCO4848 family membrane protein [Microbacterium fluvii]|uniref:SCO4848 family membrane protein n=1 Tax=Microbacterium fluvii TaxID=415215 RepID=A0ABW2HF32_9MICO|nr:hypothetical protein [Microbacterium fluvii]MCU4672211.1 hypothetical protein [Microbacterium fluvii]